MKEQILNNLGTIAIFLGIILATFFVVYLLNRFFNRLIERSTSAMVNDPTNYQFLRHAVIAMVYLVGFSIAIYTVPGLRALANSLLAGAGILAVAVGFASQHAMSNIISGIFIIIFKPFRIKDRLQIRQLSGAVEDITLRHTVIRDFENRRILIPNSLISDEIIINADFGDQRICKWINIDISYDSDLDKAKEIILKHTLAHPLLIDTRTPEQVEAGDPLVRVRLIQLGDSAIHLRAWAWAKDNADAFAMGCDLFESIKKEFDQEGIEIPFPHRTVVQKTIRKFEKP